MAHFVNINKEFQADTNFWDLNPQLILMVPFNRLYAVDGGGDYSSKLMWTIFFICDPDESINRFFKFGKDKIIEMLNETYFKDELNIGTDELELPEFKTCLEAYPDMCMSAVQRAFMLKKQSLRKRAEFLNSQEYTMETVKDLDMAHSKTAKILEEYEQLEAKFFAEQTSDRAKGGRKLSKSERKIL